MRASLTIFFLSLFVFAALAQTSKIDSLKKILPNYPKRDKNRLEVLRNLSRLLVELSPSESIQFAKEGLEEVEKGTLLEADFCMYLSNAYQNLSDYTNAIKYQQQGYSVAKKLKNTEAIASFLLTEGNIQQYLLNFQEAIIKYRQARQVYHSLNQIEEEISALNNIAIMFEYMYMRDSSEIYYAELIELVEKHLPEKKQRLYLMNYGDFIGRKKPDVGLYYLNKALYLSKKYNELNDLAVLYLAFAEINDAKKNFIQALRYVDSSKTVARARGLRRIEADANEVLASIYANMGDYKNAYEYCVMNKDTILTIVGEENAKQVNEYQAKYQTAEKEKEISLLAKENELKNKIIEDQRLITVIIIIALIGLSILSFIIFKSLKKIKKTNVLLNEQQQEIVSQKKLLEIQHQEIKDSINYAKRIQDAILGEVNHISEDLPKHFILFKPKDIVCGDFYWAHVKDDYWYVAVADCTGHGVPGAMMSMLGISALNEIMAYPEILSPANILDKLRDKIVTEMGQTGKALQNKDGMDISLLRINLRNLKAEWAGAFNPLWIIEGGRLKEIKANPQPIGYHDEMTPFTNHKLNLNAGVSAYLFTDGYADQFGGPKAKKFKYKNLEELLIKINHLPVEKQKEILNETFESWRGNYAQIDDVCIMGIKL